MKGVQNGLNNESKIDDFVVMSSEEHNTPLGVGVKSVGNNLDSNSLGNSIFSSLNLASLSYKISRSLLFQILFFLVFMVLLSFSLIESSENDVFQNEYKMGGSALPVSGMALSEGSEQEFDRLKHKDFNLKERKKISDRKSDIHSQGSEKFEIPEFPVKHNKGKIQIGDFDQLSSKIKDAYISRFKKIALDEQKKFGIPAGLVLGLAILNSEFGKNENAKEANNHFSIKCSENTVPIGKGMRGQIVNDGICYTSYSNTWNGFRANSNLLLKKYPTAFKKGSIEKIIDELNQSGYFKNKLFDASTLKAIIKMYGFDKLKG